MLKIDVLLNNDNNNNNKCIFNSLVSSLDKNVEKNIVYSFYIVGLFFPINLDQV